MSSRGPIWIVLAGALILSGCGGLEIGGERQRAGGGSSATQSSSGGGATSVSGGRSSAVFTNASAVIVGKGDTVYGLSRRHSVSARDIIEANNLNPPYHLEVGQRVVLPRGTVHIVRAGETLFGLARRYDANAYEIARANSLNAPYTIYVDQKLRIPGTAAVHNTVPSGQTANVTLPTPKPVALPKAVPQPPPATGSGLVWPVDGRVVSRFGPKDQGRHNDGINIAAAEGTPILAAENGVVAYAGNELRGFGNLLLVKHSNGYVTAYAHASKLLVQRGDKVARGQRIALVGSTGSVSSPQLHFEVRIGKKPVDPMTKLPSQGA